MALIRTTGAGISAPVTGLSAMAQGPARPARPARPVQLRPTGSRGFRWVQASSHSPKA